MSQATADPTIEALVPRGSVVRSASLVVIALMVIVAAWVLPPVLRPAVLGANGAGEAAPVTPGRRVVTTALLQPQGLGGVRINRVDAVPGVHLVDAWVVDGWRTTGSPPAAFRAGDDVLAALGVGPEARVPVHVPSGREATLVMLWQVDDCSALTDDGASIHVTGLWTNRTERLWGSPLGPPDPAQSPVCTS